LFTALVRPVIIEVAGELVNECGGVEFVVDQDPVGAF
jgi:hypothetical protein